MTSLIVGIFLFTLFSLALAAFIHRYNKSGAALTLIISFGAAPALTTIMVYYSFLILPPLPDIIYVLIAVAVFACLAFRAREVLYDLKARLLAYKPSWKMQGNPLSLVFVLALTIALMWFANAYLDKNLKMPLYTHDALVYGVTGNELYQAKSLSPLWQEDFPQSGMNNNALHAPSFPLFLTWERLLTAKGDALYQSVSAYYAILLLLLIFNLISRKSALMAVIAVLALVSTGAFIQMLTEQHLDSYRIFLMCVSFVYLARTLSTGLKADMYMFGVLSGLSAFTHSVGAISSVLGIIAFLIFSNLQFRHRIKSTTILIALSLAFGGMHYLIDMIIGRGWVLGII